RPPHAAVRHAVAGDRPGQRPHGHLPGRRPRPLRRRPHPRPGQDDLRTAGAHLDRGHTGPHRVVVPSRREVLDLLARHGLKPSRALGQHFVVDPNTVRRVARLAAVGPGDRVVEVGAGLGSLTLALAETGAAVTAVEVDRGILPVLRSLVEPAGVRVVAGDAMTLDWDTVLGRPPVEAGRRQRNRDWVLVANLPYNIATPLIADL